MHMLLVALISQPEKDFNQQGRGITGLRDQVRRFSELSSASNHLKRTSFKAFCRLLQNEKPTPQHETQHTTARAPIKYPKFSILSSGSISSISSVAALHRRIVADMRFMPSNFERSSSSYAFFMITVGQKRRNNKPRVLRHPANLSVATQSHQFGLVPPQGRRNTLRFSQPRMDD